MFPSVVSKRTIGLAGLGVHVVALAAPGATSATASADRIVPQTDSLRTTPRLVHPGTASAVWSRRGKGLDPDTPPRGRSCRSLGSVPGAVLDRPRGRHRGAARSVQAVPRPDRGAR